MPDAHVLLIDDDKLSLEVLAEILSGLNVVSTTVDDVTRLAGILESITQVDIALVDLEMPHMNGYEVLSFLRTELGADVPIVACTVYSNEMSNAKAHGFNGFIAKPIQFERFPSQFERIMNGEMVWDSK
jgi:two-component system cell cycle response regulator DivK